MKHIALIALVVLFFFFTITRCGMFVSTDYPPATIWNDTSYVASGELLSEDEVGRYIGRTQKQVRKMPTKNGESHNYPAKSQIYEIRGVSTLEAIAVKENGAYRVNTVLIKTEE